MGLFGTIIGAGVQAGLGALNNLWGREQQEEARRQNYLYGEMAAENADARTRALYNDFYSPSALLKQYKTAGLSPSLMYGGTPGQGGMSGAHGSGASGLGTPFMPMSMIEGAQMASLNAQTEKTKAETQNIKADTELKNLEEEYNKWRNLEKSVEFNISQLTITNDDGTSSSIYENAKNAKNYEEFLEQFRKTCTQNGEIGTECLKYSQTELGQKELRKIYMMANMFERDINVLSSEGVSAKFQSSIIKAMSEKGFENQNAETAVKTLKAQAETADLTTEQKSAWNNLLEKVGKKSETAKDVLIILSMMINNAATNWHMPTVHNHTTNNNIFQ